MENIEIINKTKNNKTGIKIREVDDPVGYHMEYRKLESTKKRVREARMRRYYELKLQKIQEQERRKNENLNN